jgi:hypothetical protein
MQWLLGKFSLKTIVGLLVAGLVIVFQACGVNIHDSAPTYVFSSDDPAAALRRSFD